jgi:predicted permease
VFGMGLIAARLPSPHGMLPPAFLAQLSVLSFNMLSPALLIANLAKQMNADRLMDLWPLVVWSICMSVFGLCLSYVVFRLIGVREEYL